MDFGDSVPARRRRRRPIGTETCQRQRITLLPNISPPTDGRSIPCMANGLLLLGALCYGCTWLVGLVEVCACALCLYTTGYTSLFGADLVFACVLSFKFGWLVPQVTAFPPFFFDVSSCAAHAKMSTLPVNNSWALSSHQPASIIDRLAGVLFRHILYTFSLFPLAPLYPLT